VETKRIETPNGTVAIINSDKPLIADGQSALDFAVNAGAYLTKEETVQRLGGAR
jgi:hypothetical protein